MRDKQAFLFLKKKKQKNFWMLGHGGCISAGWFLGSRLMEGKARQEVTFLKKSNQKTFTKLGLGCFTATGPVKQSFFASFCSQKEVLACSTPGVDGRNRCHDGVEGLGGNAVCRADRLAEVFWFFFSKKELLS